MYKYKILCVEDEIEIQRDLNEILSEFFDDVFMASNGMEALEIFQNNDIDMLITDINMPLMDGLELIENIRLINSEIPVLIMSGNNDTEYFLKSIKLKVDGYILKPIDIQQLIFEIEDKIEELDLKNELTRNSKLLKEYQEAIDRSTLVSKTNPKGVITFVNDAFCQISGYTSDELIGQTHSIVKHPDMPSSIFKDLWQTIKSKKPWKGVIKNRKKDGRCYYVNSHINPILNEHGEIVEFISIRQDITELENYKLNIENELEIATKEIIDTQKEVVFTMGAIGETRSKETGLHVKRVAEYSYLLALLYGLSEDEANLLRQASPMHDIGKVGIPDSVLNKAGKLDDQEWVIMQTHAQLGYEMLKHSQRDILKAAAIVAHEHHEKWDGSGYPRGLSGEDIHIFGRITAIADVFDALGHDRCYKKAWELEKILDLYRSEKAKHFDPNLIDIFFSNLDSFLKIQKSFEDETYQ